MNGERKVSLKKVIIIGIAWAIIANVFPILSLFLLGDVPTPGIRTAIVEALIYIFGFPAFLKSWVLDFLVTHAQTIPPSLFSFIFLILVLLIAVGIPILIVWILLFLYNKIHYRGVN